MREKLLIPFLKFHFKKYFFPSKRWYVMYLSIFSHFLEHLTHVKLHVFLKLEQKKKKKGKILFI